MLSRWVTKAPGIVLICFAVCATASAQYGNGGSGGSSGSTGGGYSAGTGKVIGIGVGVAAGAAVGVALLVRHHHSAARSEAYVIGCTQSVNGLSLKNEKDSQTYTILSNGTPLQLGERVELKGVVAEQESGTLAFRVHSLVKNYGTCETASAALQKPPEKNSDVARASK